MRSEESDDAASDELRQAVRATLAAGSASVRYAMHANPPELADYDFGEGVADFRERRSRVAYTGARTYGLHEGSEQPLVEQVVDRDVTYLRVGGPSGEWIELELGEPDEFDVPGDGGGFLELLNAPGRVVRLATDEQFDGKPARCYTLVIDPPRSSLRERLSGAFGVTGPSRFWLDAWTDAEGRVRRIAACDHAPNPDGTLPRRAVRITVDFDELGISAPVEVPPTT
ncbi:MAG: hypothetical protein M3401_05720 [Actinomycetota bacterium]|nr:hypothetical protein [Actinomycetota bacterium]